MMAASRIREEAALRDLLRWIESRGLNVTRRQEIQEIQEEREESEESVRWLSYILENDEADRGEGMNLNMNTLFKHLNI